MDEELIETHKFIIDRYENRTTGIVFIPMCDFSWHNERNGQHSRLQDMGLIINPRYYDNGADITLTQKVWHFFDKRERTASLSKDRIYEILVI